jgi:type II secretory pathway pseudopilin PulG
MKREVRLGHSRCVCEKLQRLTSNVQHNGRAFTVIELVGVLAIIAILAAALAPNIIKRIDRAAWQRETSDLNTMAHGLVQTILADKVVPTRSGMAVAIAKYLDFSLSQVTNTPRRFGRVFIVDPAANFGGNTLTSSPYQQTSDGLPAPPLGARMMIISTVARALPAIPANSFSDIWNTQEGKIPTSLNSWGGKGEDLCIQRVDLTGQFRKLYLLTVDRDYDGYYALEQWPSNYVSVPQGIQTATLYVLDGTALNLYMGGTADRTLESRIIVHQDESFIYQDNRWSRGLSDNSDSALTPGSFGWWVNEFLYNCPNPPPPNHPTFDATKRAVVDLFYSYMWSYWSWATAPPAPGFPGGTIASPQNPFFKTVKDNQAQMETFTGNLIK